MIVFYEYYKLLKRVIQETLRISTEIVDMYDNRLDFMADNHTIYLRPKGSRTDNWAIGSFRMIAQDVEDVIKEFDEEWKKALEDATARNIPIDTALIDPLDKGKGQAGVKRKDVVEVPPAAQKRKDTVDMPPLAPKRKKSKASKPTTETTLKEDDYDLITSRLKEEMRDSFQAM